MFGCGLSRGDLFRAFELDLLASSFIDGVFARGSERTAISIKGNDDLFTART